MPLFNNSITANFTNLFFILFIISIIYLAIKYIFKHKNSNCYNCVNKAKCNGKNLQNNFDNFGYTNKDSKKGGRIKMSEENKNMFGETIKNIFEKDIFNKNKDVNKSISCNVTNCKNHCKNKDFCSLNQIEIEAHKANPGACENVDCKSFEKDV